MEVCSIDSDPPAPPLDAGAAALRFQAPFLRALGRPRGHALLWHDVQSFERLGEAIEGDLTVAVLGRGILRNDNHPGRRVVDPKRRLCAVDMLSSGAAGAKGLHLALLLERFPVRRVGRRGEGRTAAGHGGRGPNATYLMRMPGVAPASGDSRKMEFPSPAASTMPWDSPKRIFRGARFATMMVRRPTSSLGV